MSTQHKSKCHSITQLDTDQQRIHNNKEIEIPPVALITVINTTSLSCDRFYLPGLPVEKGTPISLIQNLTMELLDQELVDIHSIIGNNTHWAKLPYIPPDLQTVLDFILKDPKPPSTITHTQWLQHPFSFITILLGAAIALFTVNIYYVRSKKNKTPNITIALPTLSTSHS